ncbi:hypothetical protein SAMN02982997_02702 [Legionella micdadei]|uniref:Uncharacterized protein n=1 Tax=Legionella micdadei TaxID=451 RepID=A0A1G5IBZ4_LEGMI|nr:hypothetical protein SAMN02982997_02702 [Legionella micdadei]
MAGVSSLNNSVGLESFSIKRSGSSVNNMIGVLNTAQIKNRLFKVKEH